MSVGRASIGIARKESRLLRKTLLELSQGKPRRCNVCRMPLPWHIVTQHHPDGCRCGSDVFHATQGLNTGPEGCIWISVLPSGTFPTAEMRGQIVRQLREEAVRTALAIRARAQMTARTEINPS